MLPAAIAGPLLIFIAYSVSFRYKLPEKARPEYWLQAVLDFLNSEPTLEAENGRNSNAACNPLEYDSLGQKMQRNKEDLCLITEFQTAIKEVMKPISDRRTQLNDSRKKLNMGCRDTNPTAKKYSPHEIRELMAAFQKLDENDDLLIDKHEFLEALVHFNPRTKHFADAAVFEIADVKKNGVIDFEEFLDICASIDGHNECSSEMKAKLCNKESSFPNFLKNMRESILI